MFKLIRAAIEQAHPDDLSIIRHYIAWVRLRRHIHQAFYQPAHLKSSVYKAHWIGQL